MGSSQASCCLQKFPRSDPGSEDLSLLLSATDGEGEHVIKIPKSKCRTQRKQPSDPNALITA